MGLIGQPVQHRFAEPRVGEHRGPLREGQIRGDDYGRSFRSSGNDLKQQLRGGLRHRHIRHLVDDDQFVSCPPPRDPIDFTVVLGFRQFVHHLGRGGETHPLPLPASLHRQSRRQVGLAGSGFPKKNDRLTAL